MRGACLHPYQRAGGMGDIPLAPCGKSGAMPRGYTSPLAQLCAIVAGSVTRQRDPPPRLFHNGFAARKLQRAGLNAARTRAVAAERLCMTILSTDYSNCRAMLPTECTDEYHIGLYTGVLLSVRAALNCMRCIQSAWPTCQLVCHARSRPVQAR